jgi:hypothetical protein
MKPQLSAFLMYQLKECNRMLDVAKIIEKDGVRHNTMLDHD